MTSSRFLKSMLATLIVAALRATTGARKACRRLLSYSRLRASLALPLPATVVVEGAVAVHGTGRVAFGENCLLYRSLYLETREAASIQIDNNCVLSEGVHLVAMAGITIGEGCMIGEYSSLRDSNHRRSATIALRDAGHQSSAICLGRQVWVGRGVTILPGVTIGDFATIGANAVVTRDVAAHDVVVGVPAKSIVRSSVQATDDIHT